MLAQKSLIFIETIDSTNSFAFKLAEEGYPHGTVVVAERQTKGRGRHGRVWHGLPGKNIYMSILLRPAFNADISLLNLLTAISVAEAVEMAASVQVRLKWPNDLMVLESIRFKKFGGILAEARYSGKNLLYVVTGIGINLNSRNEELPPDIVNSATTLLSVTKEEIDRDALVYAILNQFQKWYGHLLCKDNEKILRRWKALSLTIGKGVTAISGKKVIKGKAVDIDERGNLLLRLTSGDIEVINAGEVIHLRDEAIVSR